MTDNILVTDLLGTLVEEEEKWLDWTIYRQLRESEKEYYKQHAMDEIFNNLTPKLKSYLDNNNIIYIVTNAGHASVDFIYDNYCVRIFNNLEQYHKKINFAFFDNQRNFDIGLFDNIVYRDRYMIKGVSKDGYQIMILFYDKSQVFDHIPNYSDNLYVIGNEYHDFGMLKRGLEIGGKAAIIDYDYPLNFQITDKAFQILQVRLTQLKDNDLLEAWGKAITSEDKYKLIKLKEILSLYNLVNKEKIKLSSLVDKIDIYSSFEEYRNKVLVKK